MVLDRVILDTTARALKKISNEVNRRTKTPLSAAEIARWRFILKDQLDGVTCALVVVRGKARLAGNGPVLVKRRNTELSQACCP